MADYEVVTTDPKEIEKHIAPHLRQGTGRTRVRSISRRRTTIGQSLDTPTRPAPTVRWKPGEDLTKKDRNRMSRDARAVLKYDKERPKSSLLRSFPGKGGKWISIKERKDKVFSAHGLHTDPE